MKKSLLTIGVAVAALTSCGAAEVAAPMPSVESTTEHKLIKEAVSSDRYEVRLGGKIAEPLGTSYTVYNDGVRVERPEYNRQYYTADIVYSETMYYSDPVVDGVWSYHALSTYHQERVEAISWWQAGEVTIAESAIRRYDRLLPEMHEIVLSGTLADSAEAVKQVKDLQKKWSAKADHKGYICNVSFRMVISPSDLAAYVEAAKNGEHYALSPTPTWEISYGDRNVSIETCTDITVLEIVVD